MDGTNSSPEDPTAVGAAGTPAACRWNPTKEQINMLENLYEQGLRTPTAEQIQEITSRLQTYGHIEGKNVFYWFQNHKARQRQKQKQDHLSLFHQYQNLHHHHHHNHRFPPLLPLAPAPNVVREPCYVPQNTLGFYSQHPQVLLPSTSTIKRRSPRTTRLSSPDGSGFMLAHWLESVPTRAGANNIIYKDQDEVFNGKNYNHQETLDLFPLHPTGILQERGTTTSNVSSISSTACTSSSNRGVVDQHCFDFFS